MALPTFCLDPSQNDRHLIPSSQIPVPNLNMTAAIYFHPEAYSSAGPKLMGRNAAGESFLRGHIAYASQEEFYAYVESPEMLAQLPDVLKAAGLNKPAKAISKANPEYLKRIGTLYFPGPDIGELSWQRSFHGHGHWSLCGITHTTSSKSAMDGIVDLLAAPIQPWDAVICTSSAVKSHVERLLQAQADYLQERLGIQRLVLPQLPIIPLGIHPADFEFSLQQRSAARHLLGVDQDAIVVLYVGRLSFHAKAHPLAMYQALERVAVQCPDRRIILVECGWHANDAIRNAYQDAAMAACPNIKVLVLDGRKADERTSAWASADIFCSLSDNIQETFGITPIEAMAAGLPAVVSDWDGYRDTVRDGVDGFRIPTIMPAANLGADLAMRHALNIDTYDMYCGHTSSLVAVDIEAAAEALHRLVASQELRREMGEAGRNRAREIYDWRAIIPQYESLWKQLGEIRKEKAGPLNQLRAPWPARADPFHAFANYPTGTLTPETQLALACSDIDQCCAEVEKYRQLAMVNYAHYVLPSAEEVKQVLESARHGTVVAELLLSRIVEARRPFVFRGLAWLLKLGVLKVA